MLSNSLCEYLLQRDAKLRFGNGKLHIAVLCFSTHCGDAFWNSLYNNGRFYVHVAHC